MRLGDKEIEYNYDFRFYITTKLSNPHYAPEIATKATIVNFAVKEQGLEAQLLGIVVRKEKPELEEQKDNLVLNIAANKKKLQELEDEILRLVVKNYHSLFQCGSDCPTYLPRNCGTLYTQKWDNLGPGKHSEILFAKYFNGCYNQTIRVYCLFQNLQPYNSQFLSVHRS